MELTVVFGDGMYIIRTGIGVSVDDWCSLAVNRPIPRLCVDVEMVEW